MAPYLLHKPVDLVFHISFTVSRIQDYLLAYVRLVSFGILFAATDTVAHPAASFFEDHTATPDSLNSVHYQSLDNSKLTCFLWVSLDNSQN